MNSYAEADYIKQIEAKLFCFCVGSGILKHSSAEQLKSTCVEDSIIFSFGVIY